MGTELKTDSRHRYMLYRSNDAGFMRFASQDERQSAIDDGRKFTLAAYPDVWAKDAALVSRVRAFLGGNFPWHDRLARVGSELEIVRTLHEMVRGGSVVVVAENPPRSDGGGAPPPAVSPLRAAGEDDASLYARARQRYQVQLAKMQADATSWSRVAAINDSVNAEFMHAAVLADPVGTLPLFARAGWVSRYGLPDLSGWGEEEDVEAATPLGEAVPFEFTPDQVDGEAVELAGGEGTPGNNQAQNKQTRDVARVLGLNRDQAQRLHLEIGGEGLGYHEIMERAKDMFDLW